MKLLELSLDDAARDLALDEALLEEAERLDAESHRNTSEPSLLAPGAVVPGGTLEADGPGATETLRIWEASRPAVVIGRSSRIADEVRIDACRRLGVPVFRRTSGGAAVVIGPGCLMYSVVLSYRLRPELRMIERAHRFVLGQVSAAVARQVPAVELCGTSDLAWHGRKFSGNSLRCKRTHLLYHGTILYGFPLDQIAQCLGTPPRQPDYRRGRDHEAFVTNIPVAADDLRASLIQVWQAGTRRANWPAEMTQRLVEERYAQHAWNYRL